MSHDVDWGMAVSDRKARILWYKATLKKPDGTTDTLGDVPGHMWDAILEETTMREAWTRAYAEGTDQVIDVTAKRNYRKMRLHLYKIPEGAEVVSFSTWDPENQSELTDREHDVVRYLCNGLSVEQVAAALGTSPSTVQQQRRSAMQKLGAATTEGLGFKFASMR